MLHTDLESLRLAIGKLRKLQEQLEQLACSKKIPRKHLERALGLLTWATSACTHLRPYMAPLYKDMYSGRGATQQIHARDWHRLLDALSPDAVVQRQPLGMWLTTGAQLTEVGSQKIQSKADIPRVVSSAKPQWVRMSDPMRNEIHLRNESRAALRLAVVLLLARSATPRSPSTAIALHGSGGRYGRRLHSRHWRLDKYIAKLRVVFRAMGHDGSPQALAATH